eukprot:GHVP01030823.1.p1 GENE.GHVP01030823.1~~GHVP01030823.1.p1  ORF type:complete len:135 (+),score=29.37 GHVP01030823.1:54-458(+)
MIQTSRQRAQRALQQQIERATRYQQRKQQILNEASKLKEEHQTEETQRLLNEKEKELNTLNSEFANASAYVMPDTDEVQIDEDSQEEEEMDKELRQLEKQMRLMTVKRDYQKQLTEELRLDRLDPEASRVRIRE